MINTCNNLLHKKSTISCDINTLHDEQTQSRQLESNLVRPFIQNFSIETRDAAGCKPQNSAVKEEGHIGFQCRINPTGRRPHQRWGAQNYHWPALIHPIASFAEGCRQKWGGRSLWLVSLAGLSPQVLESKGRKLFPAWCSAWDCRISFERRPTRGNWSLSSPKVWETVYLNQSKFFCQT